MYALLILSIIIVTLLLIIIYYNHIFYSACKREEMFKEKKIMKFYNELDIKDEPFINNKNNQNTES
jgi:hypothetical protein